ncbi:MAG TPA: cytochrome c oxidase subunit 3 [Polyangia bacterium]|nr:cytochrome c oxidase subunit 3 [Polyangia bacterium]
MHAPELGEQFSDLEHQAAALRFGMWVFVVSEILLFAALFTLYAAYRTMFPSDFRAGVLHNTFAYGTANLFVLLTSGLTAALAVFGARTDRRVFTGVMLSTTAGLGLAFLAIKLTEYGKHIEEGSLPGPWYHYSELPTFGGNRFFTMYWGMTGFHALHLTAGVLVMGWMAVRAFQGRYTARYHVKLEMGSLYWALIDLMWIFLWPILYLS